MDDAIDADKNFAESERIVNLRADPDQERMQERQGRTFLPHFPIPHQAHRRGPEWQRGAILWTVGLPEGEVTSTITATNRARATSTSQTVCRVMNGMMSMDAKVREHYVPSGPDKKKGRCP
jgi:hypothetical protein